jgi:hypothetical protein
MGMQSLKKLASRKLQLVMTYAPAGLGHLRVADALYGGLPLIVNPVLLGGNDRSIQTVHRLTSANPLGRSLFEWFQSGPLSAWSNRVFRNYIRSDTTQVHEQLVSLIDDRLEPPEEILVVSTHYGLAHKLAAIKERVQTEKQVRIFLAVLVTDDTFQHIWYVDGADLMVVPSHLTKDRYAAYGLSMGVSARIEVRPYPVSQDLGTKLNHKGMASRLDQLDGQGQEPIGVSLPVSGAAVGTNYSLDMIEALRQKSDRFVFHVVSKRAPFTSAFLSSIEGRAGVEVHTGDTDRAVVDAYDDLFHKHVLSLEITKPSEQAFKALISGQSRGGVILLFSEPVGQQEFENLNFLERHALLPSRETNAKLWQMAQNRAEMDDATRTLIHNEACTWRGVRLPKDSLLAADFVWLMLTSGVFLKMITCEARSHHLDEHPDELGSDGVAQFWGLVISSFR